MSEAIEWGPPPVPHRKEWLQRLAEFVARRGEWGLLPGDFDAGLASRLAKGRHNYRLPEGRWEFVSRTIKGTSRRRIWARYLGPEQA